jgi:hypothetical protein
VWQAHVYETAASDDSGAAAATLCPVLTRALRAAGVNYDGDDDNDEFTLCHAKHVVDIRDVPSPPHNDDAAASRLLAVWSRPLAITAVGTMPPALYRASEQQPDDGQQRYVWDDVLRQGSWQNDTTTADAGATATDGPYYTLQGSLAAQGGMHRKLHQRIRIPAAAVTNTHHANNNYTTNVRRGVVEVLILLPPDLFLNVEEAVQVISPASEVEVVRVWSPAVIDQEEPAFTSPSHAVLLELAFDLADTNTDNDATVVEWNLLLHVRYPMTLSDADFRVVTMLPPVVWSLHVDGVTILPLPPPLTEEPLYLWVAAGRRAHLGLTVAVTTAAALLGALIMLRAIVQSASSASPS